MKKVIMMFAAIAMAAVANAAVLKWSVTALSGSPAGDIVSGVTTYSAYLFVESPFADTVAAALKEGDTSLLAKAATVRTQTADASGNISFASQDYGNFAKNASATFSVIVLDAATVDKAENFLLAQSGGSSIVTKVFTMGRDQTAVFSGSGVSWQSIGGDNIPEPTSGLMLLLGLAGLALKRKVA